MEEGKKNYVMHVAKNQACKFEESYQSKDCSWCTNRRCLAEPITHGWTWFSWNDQVKMVFKNIMAILLRLRVVLAIAEAKYTARNLWVPETFSTAGPTEFKE